MKKVSNFFNENEIIISATGSKLGIKNLVPSSLKSTVAYTAARMDAVRLLLNVPCTVLSFFRCETLNKAVNGAINSSHLKGEAIDFIPKMNLREAYNKIKNSVLSYDQLIIYPKQGFLHISFKQDINTERKMDFEK